MWPSDQKQKVHPEKTPSALGVLGGWLTTGLGARRLPACLGGGPILGRTLPRSWQAAFVIGWHLVVQRTVRHNLGKRITLEELVAPHPCCACWDWLVEPPL